MKKRIIACTFAALIVFCGSSVWEGAAAVASDGTLPQKGYYVATNSFPKNMIVDIINLENDMSVRVTVACGLDTPGLLALVSVDAANIIGLSSRSIGRISMSQPSDPIAFSRFSEERVSQGFEETPYEDIAALSETGIASDGFLEPQREEDYSEIAGVDEYSTEDYFPEEDAALLSDAEAEPFEILTEENPAEEEKPLLAAGAAPGDYTYQLVPAEERPPETSAAYVIDTESIIPGISHNEAAGGTVDPFYQYIMDNLLAAPSLSEVDNSSPLSVPVISRLESGRYYVQLGAYSSEDFIDVEVNRIDKSYPLALYNDGKTANPMYRIVLGPMNQGESGAVLRRFKTIGYKDAFVRRGN